MKVWVYHGDEIPRREQETERARARARQAGRSARSRGGASTGALITDVRELEPGVPVRGPHETPRATRPDGRREPSRQAAHRADAPAGPQRPTGREPA